MLHCLLQDFRYGARMLRRSPAFTAVAALSLSIGLGATAAVFSAADGVLFRTVAVRAPHEVREFRAVVDFGADRKQVGTVTPEFVRTIERTPDAPPVAGFRILDDVSLVAGDASRRIRLELVSGKYFEMLGVRPAAGRLLIGADASATPVPVVLSEALWRAGFGGDVTVVGRTVTLNSTPAIVVGIAQDFRGMLSERPADAMVPASSGGFIDASTASANLRMLVRAPAGGALARAEQHIATMFRDSGPSIARAGELRVMLVDASRGASDAREELRRPLTIGLSLVVVLLLLACANTGGLLLARFMSRSGEFGVRVAIGAGRVRLAQQLLAEALLLAGLSALAGLIVANVAAPLLLQSIPVGAGSVDFDVRFDWRLVAFTVLLGGGAALAAGAASVLRMLRTGTSTVLASNSRAVVRGQRRLTNGLIAVQVAASLSLLVAAGSMARSIVNLHRVDPGFDSTNVTTVTIDTAGRVADPSELPAYFSRLHQRLISRPEIARVSFAQVGLMTSAATTGTVEIGGWTPGTDADRWTRMFWVGPGFFEAAGMRIIAGTGIGVRESEGQERVAVVNREFARFYFGGPGQALGRMVNRTLRIVGVVADAHYNTLRDQPARAMFLPHTQAPPRAAMTFVIRATGEPDVAARAAVAAIREQDPQLKVRVAPLDDLLAATMGRERFVASIASIVSGLALLLSCGGLYAAVAYSISERRRELAVRMALGATAGNLIRLVLAGPIRTTFAGLILGVPGVYLVMRAVSALLFGVDAFDVPTVLACALLLAAVAIGASLWPARRAAWILPHDCLKDG